MRLLDLNLLLYAVDKTSPRHAVARAWIEETLSGPETVAFARSVLVGFRAAVDPRCVFERPLAVGQALDLVHGWLGLPVTTVVHHRPARRRSARAAGAGGDGRKPDDRCPPWRRWRSNTAPSCAPPTPTSLAFPAFGGPTHSGADHSPGVWLWRVRPTRRSLKRARGSPHRQHAAAPALSPKSPGCLRATPAPRTSQPTRCSRCASSARPRFPRPAPVAPGHLCAAALCCRSRLGEAICWTRWNDRPKASAESRSDQPSASSATAASLVAS